MKFSRHNPEGRSLAAEILRSLIALPILLPGCLAILLGVAFVWVLVVPFRSRRITPGRCQDPGANQYLREDGETRRTGSRPPPLGPHLE
jgi:hypothetical protein